MSYFYKASYNGLLDMKEITFQNVRLSEESKIGVFFGFDDTD